MINAVRVRRVALCSLWVACAVTGVAVAEDSSEGLRFVTQPYLQAPTADSMTVMWMTSKPCVSWVEYGRDDSLGLKAMTSRHGLVEANETIHRVRLDGLEPGTTYAYRVVSKEILKLLPYHFEFGETIASDVFHFAMPDSTADSVSFAVFNDMHESPELRELLFPLAGQRPFDLAFLNGDILDHIHSQEKPLKQLAQPYAELMEGRAPFILVRGNHETRGYRARYLLDFVATPDNRYYFSFDWGPVHFVVLDSGEDKPDDHEEYGGLVDFAAYRDEQTQWLKREIQTDAFKNAPFRVALTHIPLFGGGYGGNECRKRWGMLLNEGKIDLHLSGHTHKHEVIEPRVGWHDYPIIIGGGSKPDHATLIHVTATKKQLDVTVTDSSGQVLSTYQVARKGK